MRYEGHRTKRIGSETSHPGEPDRRPRAGASRAPPLVHATNQVHGQVVRYEGHRTKHARRHNHEHPSPPHARHPGNVQDATAPMPTETGRYTP